MSHYNSVKSKMKDQALLLAALEALGLKPTVYDQPLHLKGYQNDTREQMAHIVVHRGRTGNTGLSRSSNDLGFYRRDDGVYDIIISDFDSYYLKKRGVEFVDQIRIQYGIEAVKRSLPGISIDNTVIHPDGSVTLETTMEVSVEAAQTMSLGV